MRKRIIPQSNNAEDGQTCQFKNLLVATLRQSILDLWKIGPRESGYAATAKSQIEGRKLEALAWFEGLSGSVYPHLSFAFICESLDLDPDMLRARVYEVEREQEVAVFKKLQMSKKKQLRRK